MDSGSTADLLAAQSSDANDPLQDLVFRRVRYDTNCRHIAEQRDDRYRKFSIDDLIPLAFYTTSTELQNFRNLNLVAQIALQKYQSEKPDFFSDWQKYCKALSGRLRAVATFGTSAFVPSSTKADPFVEGAIYLAAKVVPEPERQAWVDQCLNQLSSLKHLIPANEGGRTGRKRKRSAITEAANPQPRHAASPSNPTLQPSMQQRVAVMADVNKARAALRGYLFMGTKLSHMRKQEERRQLARLTDTVRLHLAPQEGEDCMLEVRVCRSIGDAVSEAQATSMGDLTEMLGDYLFDAMESSHSRDQEKSEGKLESTNAVRVLPCEDGSEDRKLEIMLCFRTGKELYTDVFP